MPHALFNCHGYLAYKVGSHTIFIHREVMEKKLGRKLRPGELVHHKDGNKRNNDPGNLELNDRGGHLNLHRKKTQMLRLVCVLCERHFDRRANWEKHNRKQNKSGPYCGKSCAGKASRGKQIQNGLVNLRK